MAKFHRGSDPKPGGLDLTLSSWVWAERQRHLISQAGACPGARSEQDGAPGLDFYFCYMNMTRLDAILTSCTLTEIDLYPTCF